MFRALRSRGQGLVEFALVIPILLLTVLSLIEAALLFQSYLAIQHAAREAARFAVTYQPPQEFSLEQVAALLRGEHPTEAFPEETEDEWDARRAGLIKDRAVQQTLGIRILDVDTSRDEPPPPDSDDEGPGFLGVYVAGQPDADHDYVWEDPGGQGLPVQVHVYYKWMPIDPLIAAIVPQGIMLRGQAEMINEGVQWADYTPTPEIPPPTETGVPPTATYPPGWTPNPNEPTVTPTPTGTATPTLTPTPEDPYILLAPEKEAWTEAGLVEGRIEIHNHFPEDSYDVFWQDNCGERTHLGFTMTTTGGSDMADMPPPSRVERGFRYLCPPLTPGATYTGILSTELAETEVSVFVPVRPPDLTIDRIVLPEEISAGQAITVGVVISSSGRGVVSDTFDVDLYVNPAYTPILQGQPGQTTAGGSSPKQWYSEPLPRGESDELSYVILPPTAGEYELWAQVDTSDNVSELNEENNILGPVRFTLFCSDMCDDFDTRPLADKWTQSPIGARGGTATSVLTNEETLQITGTGHDIQSANDGRSFLLNQGSFGSDWEMTVKVVDYPLGPEGAMAGLMVRESAAAGERYAAIAIAYHDDRPTLQVLVRSRDGAEPFSPCGMTPVPGYLFDQSETNGEGIYLRIAREGQTFTMGTSLDGTSWHSESCMEHTFTGQPVPDGVLPGIWFAPNNANPLRFAEYDQFRLCPLGSSAPPPIRPKPPLLRECGNVLLGSDFEPAGDLLPWYRGDTPQSVQASTEYSADPDGRQIDGHSMQLSLYDACPGGSCHAWAYQEFVVPSFIASTQPVAVEMVASLYSLIPTDGPGSTGRAEDRLWLVIQDGRTAYLTDPIPITNGGQPERTTFQRFERDLAPLFRSTNVSDHVGQTLRFRLFANNADALGSSRFHVDQVRCDVCTTILPPEPEPDLVYRLGGRLLVILEGRPTRMPGVDVWAIQLPDASTPPEELGVWTTYSIHDSTYNLFNLNPGRYRIYAEVWVSGNLYSASTTIQVEAGATILDVNLNLL